MGAIGLTTDGITGASDHGDRIQSREFFHLEQAITVGVCPRESCTACAAGCWTGRQDVIGGDSDRFLRGEAPTTSRITGAHSVVIGGGIFARNISGFAGGVLYGRPIARVHLFLQLIAANGPCSSAPIEGVTGTTGHRVTGRGWPGNSPNAGQIGHNYRS